MIRKCSHLYPQGISKYIHVCILVTVLSFILPTAAATDILDNTCSFRVDGKLFVLTFLNLKQKAQNYYLTSSQNQTQVAFNFCQPFVPTQCTQPDLPKAYSYLITYNQNSEQNQTNNTCVPYTSSSKTSYFVPKYINRKTQIQLNLTMYTAPEEVEPRSTVFLLDCEESEDDLGKINWEKVDNQIIITGESPFACPVFEISSIWTALSDNRLIFGLVLFALGFVMLFYGILMTHLMIFLTAYFLSFAVLIIIFSAILTPDSSRITIYFSLLFILFLSTLIAYALTRLVNVSIFCIGAFLGFILAVLVNTLFSKIFAVYSVWSLVFFIVVFTIPFGLLTFKYSEEIIIISTSLAGAYMVVRPISWIFGGFPNQFTLYHAIETGHLKTLPWSVFIYFLIIAVIFILGALYQLMYPQIYQRKLRRRDPNAIQVSYLPQQLEGQLDNIHEKVERLISRVRSSSQHRNSSSYRRMNEVGTGPQQGRRDASQARRNDGETRGGQNNF